MYSASAPTARLAATATTPTLAPGNSRRAGAGLAGRRRTAGAAPGFTLIELMMVVALIAMAVGLVSLALREPANTRLQVEAQRLSELLESARAESRASGLAVHWAPAEVDDAFHFRFFVPGASKPMGLPTRWLDAQVRAEVVDAATLQLGPEPLIGAQGVVLRLGDQRLELTTDGLGPFVVVSKEESP
jgi:general secretion pathway protein H